MLTDVKQPILLILGAYVPLTTQGNIVVDGVLSSCYPSVPHDLAHIVMLLMTWFPKLIEWIIGDHNGFQGYVMIFGELGKWILPDGQLVKY